MFTSHKQISPPSLVLKLKISEVSQKWIPKAVELKRIPTHKKCKCKKFCSQTRLVGEIYSSDVIMHRGYYGVCTWKKGVFTQEVRKWRTRAPCPGAEGEHSSCPTVIECQCNGLCHSVWEVSTITLRNTIFPVLLVSVATFFFYRGWNVQNFKNKREAEIWKRMITLSDENLKTCF